LEGLNESLRNVESRLQRESDALEDLSNRVAHLTVGRRDEQQREQESIRDEAGQESDSTVQAPSTFDVASAALNSEWDAGHVRDSIARARKQPLFNATSNDRPSALNHSIKSSTSSTKRSGVFGLDLPSTPIKSVPTATKAVAPTGFAAAQLPTNGASFFNLQPVATSGLKSSFRAAHKTSDKKHGSRSFSAYSDH
jgi:hypothetical protein